MITLTIPPKYQISRVAKMLSDEFGTASHIKSSSNKDSVKGAISSTLQKLKLYSHVPPNGLVVFCGTAITEDGKEKMISIAFEPFKSVKRYLYLCSNKFQTEVCLQ